MQFYPNSLRKLNIRARIMLFLILGIIIFSSILLYTSKLLSSSLVENNFYNYLEKTQQEMEKGVELFINEINMLTVRILQSESIYNLISDEALTVDEKQEKLRDIFDNMVIDKQAVGDIVIVTEKGDVFSYADEKEMIQRPDNTYIEEMKQNKKLITWGPVKKDIKNNAYILMGKKYRNFSTGQILGYMVIYIREDALFNIYKKITPDMGSSFLVSEDGYIISHPDKNKVGNIIFDSDFLRISGSFNHYITKYNGQESIFAASRFNEQLQGLGCNWKIVSIIPQEKLFERIQKINIYVIISEILMSITAIIVSTRVSFRIVRPIRLLNNKIKNFGKGNIIKLSFVEKTEDEIWELEKTYNEMISRISDLISKNNEEKEKQRKLELTALQAQINPHFLYNTLDAIGWIAKLKKQEDIEKLVMALARFFRISLHKGDKFISLQEEIELVNNFIIIEQIRFPGKFDVEYHIDEEVLCCKVLKLTLQPIVENAIKHGISLKKEKGLIVINGYRSENDLVLEVLDNGVGFDVAQIAESDVKEYKHGGYGLHNVDERIKLEYGDSFGIRIFSKKGEGTRVEIRLKTEYIA